MMQHFVMGFFAGMWFESNREELIESAIDFGSTKGLAAAVTLISKFI